MAMSLATMTTGTCSNKDQRTIGHCLGVVGDRPLRVARPPQQLREQLRTGCQHDVQQQAKTSYHPRDHVKNPDPNSARNGELLTDGLRVCRSERSSGLLVVQNAEDKNNQHRTEGVKICHDRRFSGREEKSPTQAQKGNVSNRTQRTQDGRGNMIMEMTRNGDLDKMAADDERLKRSLFNDVPDNDKMQLQVHEILREIGMLPMSAVSTCYFECLDAIAASSMTRQYNM